MRDGKQLHGYMSYKSYIRRAGENVKALKREDGQELARDIRRPVICHRGRFHDDRDCDQFGDYWIRVGGDYRNIAAGMTVQKENRQETIINQDANMFLECDSERGQEDSMI